MEKSNSISFISYLYTNYTVRAFWKANKKGKGKVGEGEI